MSEPNDFKGKASLFAATAAKKARGLAAYAATKTKQLSRIAKLNVEISSQKDTIKNAYAEIGKLYYEAHKDAPEGFFLQLCQEIDTANEAIAAMEAEIAQMKADGAPEDADFASVVDGAEPSIQVEIVANEEANSYQPSVHSESETPAQKESVAGVQVSFVAEEAENAYQPLVHTENSPVDGSPISEPEIPPQAEPVTDEPAPQPEPEPAEDEREPEPSIQVDIVAEEAENSFQPLVHTEGDPIPEPEPETPEEPEPAE